MVPHLSQHAEREKHVGFGKRCPTINDCYFMRKTCLHTSGFLKRQDTVTKISNCLSPTHLNRIYVCLMCFNHFGLCILSVLQTLFEEVWSFSGLYFTKYRKSSNPTVSQHVSTALFFGGKLYFFNKIECSMWQPRSFHL